MMKYVLLFLPLIAFNQTINHDIPDSMQEDKVKEIILIDSLQIELDRKVKLIETERQLDKVLNDKIKEKLIAKITTDATNKEF